MAQNQDHGSRSRVLWPRQGLNLRAVRSSGSVPANKKSAVYVAVVDQVVDRAVGIGVDGNRRVVATPAFGFVRVSGGSPNKKLASHITNRSSSFRPSASTGRGIAAPLS